LQNYSGITESKILNKKLDSFFSIDTQSLKEKIKTTLELKIPSTYKANEIHYIIPLKTDKTKHTHFKYMQQDVSITPLDEESNLVLLVLTDQTIMANTTTLLKANIETIQELNSELIRERDTIDKKVLVLKCNPKLKIIEISQALLQLLHYNKEELINQNFLLQEKYNMTKKLQGELLKATQELKVLEFEERTLSAHGQRIYFKSTLIPEFSAKGKHIGFILFREDITDAKYLAKSQEKILASSRSSAMGEMVAMIAHQWRQPLSLINTIMATLKVKQELNTLKEENINEAFEKIQNTSKYLSDTIDDFRDYFKPNKLSIEVNLFFLFNNSIFFLKEEMDKCSIEYKIEINADIVIKTYKNELLQSIINILKNSIDAFSTKDIPNKRIFVKVVEKESHISILLEDNAGGIDKGTLRKVFEPYFSTKSKNSTGLGLYMCHTIVSQHLKGQITMSSKDDKTYTLLELPYKLLKEKNASNLPPLS